MSRTCQVTGARPGFGNNVPHSHRRTRRRFDVNVQRKRYWVPSLGRQITYITERAVFELRDGRLTLTEIAPGLDLQRDVLAVLGAPVVVADDLKNMDARIFTDAPMFQAAG